jgi:hypothetical protein
MECDVGCPGWAWFNQCEIQRCDTCERFSDDLEAAKHIVGCPACAVALGLSVASTDVFVASMNEGGSMKEKEHPLETLAKKEAEKRKEKELEKLRNRQWEDGIDDEG